MTPAANIAGAVISGPPVDALPLAPEALRLLLALVCAHLLVDFAIQTDRDARAIERLDRRTLVKHGAQHGLLAAAIVFPLPGLWVVLVGLAVGATHALVDAGKSALVRALRRVETRRPVARWLLVFAADQALHLIVLFAVVRAVSGGAPHEPWWVWGPAGGEKLGALMVALGFLVSVPFGGVVIGRMTAPFDRQIRLRGWRTSSSTGGLRDGGRTIGLLERAVIYFLIIGGNPGGVGFLIAAKSIFRFGELRDRANRMEAEYFLIGTLMSFAWALAVSVGVVWTMARLPAA